MRDFENIRAGLEVMKFGVATEQMRRMVGAIANAIGAALRAASWLDFLHAVVALPARGAGSPRHAVAGFHWLARPVALQSFANLFEASDGFVAEYHRKRNRKLTFPEVNIGSADARHLRANQRRAGFQSCGQRKLPKRERRVEGFEDGGSGVGHNAGDFAQSLIPSWGGSGGKNRTRIPMTAMVVARRPAAWATWAGRSGPLRASIGATRFVVTKAMPVPNIRPPTLVAKLPPVPRKCRGKALGRYSPK